MLDEHELRDRVWKIEQRFTALERLRKFETVDGMKLVNADGPAGCLHSERDALAAKIAKLEAEAVDLVTRLNLAHELSSKAQRDCREAIEKTNTLMLDIRRRLKCRGNEPWYDAIDRLEDKKADLERRLAAATRPTPKWASTLLGADEPQDA